MATKKAAGPLSGKARRHLRALGHHLQPIVQVGKGSLTEAVVKATTTALADHELIKVRLGENVEGERREVAAELATATKAELIGVTGRTLLLYKRHPKKPKLELPSDKPAKGAKAEKSKSAKKAEANAKNAKKMAAKATNDSKNAYAARMAARGDASEPNVADDDDGDFEDDEDVSDDE